MGEGPSGYIVGPVHWIHFPWKDEYSLSVFPVCFFPHVKYFCRSSVWPGAVYEVLRGWGQAERK